MTTGREQMDQLLKQIEREAYARGWADAIATLQARVSELPKTESVATESAAKAEPIAKAQTATVVHPGGFGHATAIKTVRDIIFAQPGLRGADIVRESERSGRPIQERTVRSCLHRLKGKDIWKREGRWYPKRKVEIETANGEALGAAPH